MKKTYYSKKYDTPSSLSDKRLLEILNFYLLNSPVAEVSCRGLKFREYGFKGPAFSTLKAALLKSASESLKSNYKACKKSELEDYFEKAEAISPPDEYCYFLVSDEKTAIESLFKAIRNSFAHGSFNVKTYNGVRIYFLLNFHTYKKAQIVLHEKTLLAWIKIIQSGYDNIKR